MCTVSSELLVAWANRCWINWSSKVQRRYSRLFFFIKCICTHRYLGSVGQFRPKKYLVYIFSLLPCVGSAMLFPVVVVVVRIFNATRHPRHIEAAAIAMMYMHLYSLAFMDHPCTLGAAVCHQAPPCPLYTQPRARRVWARRNNGLKIVSTRAGFEPTISRLKVERANH